MTWIKFFVGSLVAYFLAKFLLGGKKLRPQYANAAALPNPTPGESPIIRSPISPTELKSTWDRKILTLYDNFRDTLARNGEKRCLGRRVNDGPYTWLSYQEVDSKFSKFSSGMATLFKLPGGQSPGKEVFVGLFAPNCLEWFITENACYNMSWVPVPLYDTLGDEAISHIFNQTQLPVCIVTKDKMNDLMALISAGKVPHLRHIVQIQRDIKPEHSDAGQAVNVTITTFADVEAAGAASPVVHVPPKPTDLATLCYTSGTTGLPKGVMLTHGNFIAELTCARLMMHVTPEDVHICYLPLAHVYERLVEHVLFADGCSIGLFRGDILKLFEDIALLRPTVFPSVPRLFNRLFDKIMANVNAKPHARFLFSLAYAAKKRGLENGQLTHWFWDRLVFRKMRAALGGRVRLMTCASAPLAPQVMEFLRICFSCPVLEGYGQTENCGAACGTFPDDYTTGHVGTPLLAFEIKLVDVVDMNYRTTDRPHPRGEICLRGPAIMSGYYKEPEKTKETIDADGWLHTGDIGQLTPANYIRIIDRKKNIFKLAQGEYVAPEKIENVYVRCSLVEQVFVHGNSLKATLVAIVVPDAEEAASWAAANSHASDLTSLCQSKPFEKAVLSQMEAAAKEANLKGFEQVRRIKLIPNRFTVESDILTSTFKLKRHQASKFFSKELEQLYVGLD